MTAAITLSRPALPGSAPPRSAPADGPVLLVVGRPDLDELATHFVMTRPGARLHCCAQDEVMGLVCSTAPDLILLNLDASPVAGIVLAAHIRAAERGRDAWRCAAIVATTSSERNFRDCPVGLSAIDGLLKMPCDALSFANLVDRWWLADDLAAQSRDEAGRLAGG